MYRTTIPREKLIEVAEIIEQNGIKDIHYNTLKRMLGVQSIDRPDWIRVRSRAITELNHDIFPTQLQTNTFLSVVRGRGIVVLRDAEGTSFMLHQSIMRTQRKLNVESIKILARADNAKSPEEEAKLRAMNAWTEEARAAGAARALASHIIDEPLFIKLMATTRK
jgi:hypothetical protein